MCTLNIFSWTNRKNISMFGLKKNNTLPGTIKSRCLYTLHKHGTNEDTDHVNEQTPVGHYCFIEYMYTILYSLPRLSHYYIYLYM